MKNRNRMIARLKLNRPEEYSKDELQTLHKIVNALFHVLSTAQDSFSHRTLRLSKPELEELSTVIVEFAEDILGGIGIWKSLEKYNYTYFGTPLPFSSVVGQELTEAPINERRIHFLLWNKYLELCDGIILSPGHKDLNFLVGEIVQFFDDQRITEFPKDSSIKALMDQPNQYGWDIKKKLLWLGRYSYLFRHSFEIYVNENGGKPKVPVIDDFVCQNASRWSGLGVPDILAEILDISKRQSDELQSWSLRHLAYYRIESVKSPMIVAQNMICHKKYSIRVGKQSTKFKIGHIYLGSLVPWNGEWYWSGQQAGIGELSQENLEGLRGDFLRKSPQIAYRYCDSLLEKAKNSIKRHHRNFVTFHGDDLATFPDGYAMAAAIQKQHRLEIESQPKDIQEELMRKWNLNNPWPSYSYPSELLGADNGIGVFFNQSEGQEIMREFNDIERGFEKRGVNLSLDEVESIRGFIASPPISPEFVEKLAKKYGAESIAAAFLLRDADEINFLKYILRQYKGQYFKTRYPNLTLV